jgi:hypothetical protein
LALIDQQQEQKQKQPVIIIEQKQKQVFFVLRKKGARGSWDTISYFDDEGHFRGIACFEDFHQAVRYQKIYEDKMIKKYLHEGKGKFRDGSSIKHHFMMSKDTKVKLFIEHTRPSVYSK